MAAHIASLRVGRPRWLGGPELPWLSGFVKEAVAGPVAVGRTNLEGDGQADLEHHGGPDKAVCAYPAAHYPAWRAELALEEFPFGAFGENFTVAEVIEEDVCIGDTWAAGTALFEVSQPRQPCAKLARRWGVRDLPARVLDTGRTGWYFRVPREGSVAAGDALTLVSRPHPAWTIARANAIRYRDRDAALAAELAALAPLSASWRAALSRRG